MEQQNLKNTEEEKSDDTPLCHLCRIPISYDGNDCHSCDVDFCEGCYNEQINLESGRETGYSLKDGTPYKVSCPFSKTHSCLLICCNCCKHISDMSNEFHSEE